MKYSIFFMLLGILSVSAESYAQKTKLSIDVQNGTLYEVVSEIEKQTGFMFFYKSGDIDKDMKVSIRADNMLIADILTDIFKNSGLAYVVDNKHILIAKKSNPAFQQIEVTGTVTDGSEPLPGANVVIKGTNTGVVADFNGRFSISVPDKDVVLQFSFVGYAMQEFTVGNQTVINVALKEEASELAEVVVVGYGTVRKRDLTGSIAQIKTEQFSAQQSTNLLDYLNGTTAGFNVSSGTSASGASSMEIRGPASLAANNNPLIVLDGVIYNGSINDINPLDIETIDILKDASSAAVYGARAAAGVVIISTKRGKSEKVSVNFSAQVGLSDFTSEIRPFGLDGYLKYREDWLVRTNPGNPAGYYSNPNHLPAGVDLATWQSYDAAYPDNPTEAWMHRLKLQEIEKKNYRDDKSYDWYDAGTQTGVRQNYNVGLSGGTEKVKYYWSLGYIDNKGRVKGDEFKAINSRINAEAKVTNFLTMGINAQFGNRDMSAVQISFNNDRGTDIIRMSPLGQPYNTDGTIRWYPHDDSGVGNPFRLYDYRDKFNVEQSLFANTWAEVKLPFGFSYKISYINRLGWGKNYYYDPVDIPSGYTTNGFGQRINTSLYEWQLDNVVSWKKRFGVHDFYATLLYNAEKLQSWNDTGKAQDFSPNGLLSYHELMSGMSQSLDNDDKYSTGTAMMGRLNYTLMDRYLLTVSIRRDGYSAFGINHPYAVFPSGALAWSISEEPFFKVSWINTLKARVSYGVNGNRDIGVYEALAKLGTTKYLSDGQYVSGVYSNTMANSDLRWERTAALNFGVDFAVLENRLSGSLDYYDMSTTDLLLTRQLPEIIGYKTVMSNMGELLNKGFEMTLNSQNIRNGQFTWNSSLVFSLNRNKIKHLYGEMVDVTDASGKVIGRKEADDRENGWFIGQAIDRIWDYEFLGIYQLGEEEAAQSFGKAPGDTKLLDVDKNGVSTEEDKTFQGYTRPRYRIGFRNNFTVFKHFDVSIFLRAQLGNHSANGILMHTDHMGDRRNEYDVPYWTPENPMNKYTRLNTVNNPGFSIYESCGFVRLQDMTVAYNLLHTLSRKIGMEAFRVYFSAHNLLTFSKWSGWDTESGNTPMPRIFTLGVNISL
ncbi:MAG: SusC/RagA family TonB-linked outer membrane protein [Bacteroidales bacterium]|nr:SusC/RagA family TonB-linked outer membrane protein [Bacteroidales bacterium]